MRKRTAIVGAGPAGICMGIALRRAGLDFTIFERAEAIGGTWHHNSYPGAACDIPSALYQFSFDIRCDWSRPYAPQPEIRAYLQDCAARHGLLPHVRLSTPVIAARWDEARALWTLTTGNGASHEFEILVSAVGMFGDPQWPDIDGLHEFGGALFHSARWAHGHDLGEERVAVIGSAASAVQVVPAIAPRVQRLHVFQRTPNWVLAKQDAPYSASELARFGRDPAPILAARREAWDWLEALITFADPAHRQQSETWGRENAALVADAGVRARLTPDYPFGSKRALVSNDWFPAFNRDNVELVTEPIARVTHGGIRTADGRERQVDTIVLATGFATTRFASVMDVIGRGGLRLRDAWSDGAQAYLGIAVPAFPNLFMLYGPNTNNGSILFMIECQVEYILRRLARMGEEALDWLDVRPAALAAYDAQLQRDLQAVQVWQTGTRDYYRAASGRIVTQWPCTMSAYHALTTRPDPGAWDAGRRTG
ncbi:MAG: flavin-containing monooxygenase [Gammaproteobacteria bacterium]